jgi:hypothetical protein
MPVGSSEFYTVEGAGDTEAETTQDVIRQVKATIALLQEFCALNSEVVGIDKLIIYSNTKILELRIKSTLVNPFAIGIREWNNTTYHVLSEDFDLGENRFIKANQIFSISESVIIEILERKEAANEDSSVVEKDS